MARETILNPQQPDDEDEQRLRPRRLHEVVGQRDVLERLGIALEAAIKRDEPLGHVMLDGPPGLGKTTLALCVPEELGVPVQMSSGPVLKAPKDLLPLLTNLEERSVLFIDEIHRISKPVEEYLYTAMEDFRIDIILGEGINARTINYSVKPFTLIGATTRSGMLSAPFRDRFQIREHLDFYSIGDLGKIVRRNAEKLNTTIDDVAADEIASRSRGTPRVANSLLRWVRDYCDSRADGHITLAVARAALEMFEVDELGLNKLDRQYLNTIVRVFGGGPAGIEAIAHTMNASPDTLTDDVEPFLLRSELVIRSPRGRMVTPKAFDHLGIIPPEASGGQRALF